MDNPIDKTALANLLDSIGGDEDFLRELVETFFLDAPEQFSALNTALAADDADTFRRAAHSLKSNAASFGAGQLTSLCKQLEDVGKSGDLSAATTLIEAAAAEYAEVEKVLSESISQN